MVEALLDDTKFLVVPKALANQLRIVSGRLGISVTDYTHEVLSQALRIDEMDSSLQEAIDVYRMVTVHRGAGFFNLQRSGFNELLSRIDSRDLLELRDFWYESGKWYGAYLVTQLSRDEVFGFLEKDLKIIWNLDEVEIKVEDVVVQFRASSFNMSEGFTELLVLYTRGLFEELGYSVTDEDALAGLVSLKLLKKIN